MVRRGRDAWREEDRPVVGAPDAGHADGSRGCTGAKAEAGTLTESRRRATAFRPGVGEKIGYYVYLLTDPRDGDVYYVGKGTGNRCFAHVKEARKTVADSVRDYPKLARIREIEASGHGVRIDILRHGLTEPDALLVESVAIDLVNLLDHSGIDNRVAGHHAFELGFMSVAEMNARYGSSPVRIDTDHRVMLIRINRLFDHRMTDEELYEATRKWWRVGAHTRTLGTPLAPEWAMSVYGGIVRAVYRIQGWEGAAPEDIDADPIRAGRWVFRGTRDRQMENVYLNGDVSAYLRQTQNPVRLVNCGRD
jgi:uncharacterized protein